MNNRIYFSIDLKSFFASVECIDRGLDPMNTNLVVADNKRTEKTICLAVTPTLKAYGISGRSRLFEVVQKVREVNIQRLQNTKERKFIGSSHIDSELKVNPELSIDYIVAPPRMALYIDYSTRIYNVYLKYIAPEDMHVYSIDEVFMDVTEYLNTYHMTPYELAQKMILDVRHETGITASGGIGTNLYLSKIAMDIMAKHAIVDDHGVQIAQLDEITYREKLWNHRPLTDFWRIGKGYKTRLEAQNLMTMGDIARCSIGKETDYYKEDLLYKMFGINAELLIDHAWGHEPCTIADIKAYKPGSSSIGTGQVLQDPYPFDKARIVIREMAELLALDLVSKRFVTDQIVLTVGYDIENLSDDTKRKQYKGEIIIDNYGRSVPKGTHGTANLTTQTASTRLIMDAVTKAFDKTTNPNLLIRRLNLSANHVVDESKVVKVKEFQQLSLFDDYHITTEEKVSESQENEQEEKDRLTKTQLEKEKKLQHAMLDIKKKYGKNAILKGMNFEEGATAKDRNKMIGGHKA